MRPCLVHHVDLAFTTVKPGLITAAIRWILKQTKRLRNRSRKEAKTAGDTNHSSTNTSTLSLEQQHALAIDTFTPLIRSANILWLACVMSLPLDLLLFELGSLGFSSQSLVPYAYPLLVFCAVYAYIFSFRNSILTKSQQVATLLNDKKQLKQYLFGIAVGLLLILYLAELYLQSREMISVVLIQIVVYGSTIVTILRKNRSKALESATEQARILLKRDFYLASIMPIVAARFVSLLGILCTLANSHNFPLAYGIAYATASALLLYELEPSEAHFYIPCKRCALKLPIPLFQLPQCPRCVDKSP